MDRYSEFSLLQIMQESSFLNARMYAMLLTAHFIGCIYLLDSHMYAIPEEGELLGYGVCICSALVDNYKHIYTIPSKYEGFSCFISLSLYTLYRQHPWYLLTVLVNSGCHNEIP